MNYNVRSRHLLLIRDFIDECGQISQWTSQLICGFISTRICGFLWSMKFELRIQAEACWTLKHRGLGCREDSTVGRHCTYHHMEWENELVLHSPRPPKKIHWISMTFLMWKTTMLFYWWKARNVAASPPACTNPKKFKIIWTLVNLYCNDSCLDCGRDACDQARRHAKIINLCVKINYIVIYI